MPWGFNQFNQSVFNGLWESLTAPLWDWLNQYPLLYWLTLHPLWLMVTLVALLFLLSGLLGAIARLTERLWLAILRLPITLMQWIWRGSLFLLSRPFAPQSATKSAAPSAAARPIRSASLMPSSLPNPEDRLTEVLSRLEALRQEQDELLQEVKTLLSIQSVNR